MSITWVAIEFIPYNLIFCYYSKQDEFSFEMKMYNFKYNVMWIDTFLTSALL